MTYIVAYIAAALVFLVLDMIWLAGVARPFYQAEIGGLLRESPDLAVAGVFYAGYVAGVIFFAVAPALDGGGLGRALLNGALIGALAYGTYDATNLATLRDYSLTLALVDTAWGTFLTASAAGAGYFAASRLTG